MTSLTFYDEYLKKFNRFLTNETFAGTYKFVFLKSLLYLAGDKNGVPYHWGEKFIHTDGGVLKLDLDFIAIPYTKYYWDMFYKFRLRQSSTGNQYFTCQNCDTLQSIPKFVLGKHNCKNCGSKNLENKSRDVNIHKNFQNEKDESIKPPKYLSELVSKFPNTIKNVIYGNKCVNRTSSAFGHIHG